jgi:hypothetical protein
MAYAKCLISLACLATLGGTSAKAQEIKTVFVIAMENHNRTQPANQFTGGIQQIYLNPNAPFINSLVNGTAVADMGGSAVNVRITSHLILAGGKTRVTRNLGPEVCI